ncbi:MAG: formylmethanofuran dehydrogenase subunit E family protein [Candidatus Bathyarchaeota archaeon]|nr:formylmethanofuran dehydrogenase subunit E family protein [Candidatus Bathyarchaeota archaeon]
MLEEKLKLTIKEAEKLHGHLGPFLVLGVRMGETAKKILKISHENTSLQVTAKLPLRTPFSCVLDGIQATTQCTIGNQKLKIENSSKEISAKFQCTKTGKILMMTANQKITEALMKRLSEGVSNEELVWKIARTPENQLFTMKKQ